MANSIKTFLLWAALVALIVFSWNFSRFNNKPLELTFSGFMELVESGEIKEVTINRSTIKGHLVGGAEFKTTAPPYYDKVLDALLAKKVSIRLESEETSGLANMLISWAPFILLIGFWLFFMKQMQRGGNKALSFGKSRAKLLVRSKDKVTFKDVAGVEEAKDELREIIEFLKEPQKFQRLGGRIPKGVLLMGPPGTGKTLLARSVAGEANVPFFSISGSDFVEMFVGVGASRVRDLFEQGKKNAPCIIFIDEIDAVGRHRGAGLGGGHDEREQTLNQLLVEMDGFESNTGVILIAATNRPDVLDPALLRPGRFDRRVVVPRPDVRGREEILKVHTAKIPLDQDVDLSVIARGTPGMTGADLANLVNEAALLAARQNKSGVANKDFEASKDKVLMGAERKSVVMTESDKWVTAIHEGGHTLVAAMLYLEDSKNVDPLHKVTIIPRGLTGGSTWQLPKNERFVYGKKYLENRLAIFLGGRMAEKIVLGEITNGAGSDLEGATEIATNMVKKWGMAKNLDLRTFGNDHESPFLGLKMATESSRNYSEETARRIDTAIGGFVTSAENVASQIITSHRNILEKIAHTLMEKETLTDEEILVILKNEKEIKES